MLSNYKLHCFCHFHSARPIQTPNYASWWNSTVIVVTVSSQSVVGFTKASLTSLNICFHCILRHWVGVKGRFQVFSTCAFFHFDHLWLLTGFLPLFFVVLTSFCRLEWSKRKGGNESKTSYGIFILLYQVFLNTLGSNYNPISKDFVIFKLFRTQ